MSRSRNCNAKGRRISDPFAAWPRRCHDAERYRVLSFPARALLVELQRQFRGNNNGDLTCAYAVLRPRGWKSRSTIERAAQELEYYGWIIRTRQGGLNMPNLYAVTWHAIDECDGKLDLPPGPAPGTWKDPLPEPWSVVKKRIALHRRATRIASERGKVDQKLTNLRHPLVAERG